MIKALRIIAGGFVFAGLVWGGIYLMFANL
jgi:hypothetical protein